MEFRLINISYDTVLERYKMIYSSNIPFDPEGDLIYDLRGTEKMINIYFAEALGIDTTEFSVKFNTDLRNKRICFLILVGKTVKPAKVPQIIKTPDFLYEYL